MRVGSNPEKNSGTTRRLYRHRVIMPVFIPVLDGYFAELPEIVELSLRSLFFTTADEAFITVVLNGCCEEIVKKAQKWFEEGLFHQLVINRENLGKVDGTLSIAKGAVEEFITITDCDVLFKPGWLAEVEKVFAVFPESGFVSPVPAPHLSWYCTTTTILHSLLKREVLLGSFVSKEDMQRFAESVGTPGFVQEKQIVIQRGNSIVCVGAGHFVFTVRREVVKGMPESPAGTTLSSEADTKWFDIPPDKMGYWRVSTLSAFANHMGNVPEPWMYTELKRCREESKEGFVPVSIPPSRQSILRFVPLNFRQRLVRLIKRTRLFKHLAHTGN